MMTIFSEIREHTHLSGLKEFSSWSDIAGALALIAAIGIGYFDHGLYTWKFGVSILMTTIYFFITWGLETDDIRWLKNLKLATLTAIPTLFILLGINGWAAVLMFFVLSATAMYVASPRYGYYWICGFGLLICLAYLTVWSHSGNALVAIGTFAGFLFIGSATESQIKAIEAKVESQRLFGELEYAHRQLQERADQAEELAVSSERNRLARDVHDTLGHQLTVAAVQLEGAQKLIRRDPDKAEEMVSTVRSQVLEGLSELRKTISTLRAPIEEDLSLPNALNLLTDNFERATGIDTHLILPQDLPVLPSAHRQALFRSVQESLTNIQKHAAAEQAWVKLSYQNGADGAGTLLLSIVDDGVGLSPAAYQQGFGLIGMSERASHLGGTAEAKAKASGGTEILVSLPLELEAAEQYPSIQSARSNNNSSNGNLSGSSPISKEVR